MAGGFGAKNASFDVKTGLERMLKYAAYVQIEKKVEIGYN